jgi:hypothetical protein
MGTPPSPSALGLGREIFMRRLILGSMIAGLLVVGLTMSQVVDRLP